jgi:hypothetical protein
MLLGGELGESAKKRMRIWMSWRSQNLANRPLLQHEACIHHCQAVGSLGDHPEVVRDEDHRHALVRLKVEEEFQDLILDRHVQSRRRFVGDQELGVAADRHGDRRPLSHPTGKLVWVRVHSFATSGKPHALEQFERPQSCDLSCHLLVRTQHFGELSADRAHRIEARCRVLEHHAYIAAPQFPHGPRLELENAPAVEGDRTAAYDRAGRQEPDQRAAQDALPGS